MTEVFRKICLHEPNFDVDLATTTNCLAPIATMGERRKVNEVAH